MIQHNPIDQLIHKADEVLRTISGTHNDGTRPYPGDAVGDASPLGLQDKKYSTQLMRINHAGEIAAQGLYHGQTITAHSADTREQMMHNAQEESDHLRWCRKRLQQLGGNVSIFSPVWYLGSVGIGMIAGLLGDRVSHAFVKETEDQVVEHLQSHLEGVSVDDKITRSVLEQMQKDEARHADNAKRNSEYEMPFVVRQLMRSTARIMTTTARWV